MTDSTLPLQKAIVATLRKHDATKPIVDQRVFDAPSPGAQKPYVSIGPVQMLPEIAQDYDGADVRMQIDGWAAGPSSVGAKQLGRAIYIALQNAELQLEDDQRLVALTVEDTRYLLDADGVTQHAVVVVRARTEPT